MVAWAIEGLPGAQGGAVDPDAWRRRRDPFAFELMGPVEPFVPRLRCWQPFVDVVAERRTPIAKVQLCGPDSVLAAVRPQDDELKDQIRALLGRRAQAMAGAVARAGARCLFFVDEPMPGPELGPFLARVKAAGAMTGVHCCGHPDWAALLALKPDVLSFDARLGLDALLEDPAALRASGTRLGIGVIPTDPGARYDVRELADAVDVTLRSTGCLDLLARALVTPACGLATRTVADAERIWAELSQVQALLRA
jgi:hypothetical protein